MSSSGPAAASPLRKPKVPLKPKPAIAKKPQFLMSPSRTHDQEMDDIGASLGLGAPPPVPPHGEDDDHYMKMAVAAAAMTGGGRTDSPPPYIPPVAPAAVTTVTTTLSDLTSTTMSNIAISSTGGAASSTSTPPSSVPSLSPGPNPRSWQRFGMGDIPPLPPALERTIKIKKGNEQLGMTVDAVDKGVNGCIVKTITSGAIAQDGRIQVGDYILTVNNETLKLITNAQARAILRRASLLGIDLSITYIPGLDAEVHKQSALIIMREQGPPPPSDTPSQLSPKIFPKYYRIKLLRATTATLLKKLLISRKHPTKNKIKY